MLLDAVAAFRAERADAGDLMIFRFGHVTHADPQLAQRLAHEGIEADVNLDSNISTGAYSLQMMSDSRGLQFELERYLSFRGNNFALNDFPALLIPRPDDDTGVGRVLGNAALKYLLQAGVRVLLGGDGAGVEHAELPRQYALAASLIRDWRRTDPWFSQTAPDLKEDVFMENARRHLREMAGE
ncbi:MAG: hypothetical protein MO853_06930 [Candidatus Protistobacter heckmanni]|nr:hypothetical protein [Candidatus Protistobacter heckmanni]